MNTGGFPRLLRAMQEQHLDGLLAVSPENVAYVMGFPVVATGDPRWRQAAALATWDGRSAILCVDAHADAVRRRVGGETVVRVWAEFGDNPIHTLADLMSEFHLGQSRMGTELDCLAASDFQILRSRFPKVVWTAVEGLFTRLRRIKGPVEVEQLRHLARIVDQAVLDTLANLKADINPREVRALVSQRVLQLGAEECRVALIGADVPGRGDRLGVEVSALLEGYHGIIGRTIVSRLSPVDRERWQAVLHAHRALIGTLTPDDPGSELQAGVDRLQAILGLRGESLVAHGVGLATVEEPLIGPFPEARVQAGMVLAVGPSGAPWTLRDMVLMTAGPPELLTYRSDPDQFIR
jgi:Xaa-Pro aminopeptidase